MKILQKGKRGLALCISLCLVWTLACFAVSRNAAISMAYAETGQLSDGTLLYRQYDTISALIVTGTVSECSGDVVIPETWDGMSVVEIASDAFSGQTGITSVTVPGTVQKIGADAFRGCTSLAEVNLENTLMSVGAGAFEETAWSAAHADDEMMILDDVVLISVSESLEELFVPDTVRVIADEACMDNTSLKTAVIKGSTGYIGNRSFYGCTGLTDVTLPNGVKNIGDYAFAYSMITRAVIPSTVLSVGKSAFLNCTALEQVTLWEGIVRIGSSAFSSCSALKQITVPDSVTEIGSSAFKQCTSLQQVSLGIHVTEIQNYTFQECTSLSSISIGSQVRCIGVSSFNKCTALQSITLPEGLVQIGSKAFQSCMSLSEINIPSSVLDIGTNAFFDTMFYNNLRAANSDSSFVIYNNTVLLGYYGEDTIVQIPSGIQVIGGSAFGSNETIEMIMLPSSIISLSSYAFENLWTMEQLTGMEYLQYVGVYAFGDCISLKTLNLTAVLGTVREGAAIGCESLSSVNIADGITGIEADAFRFSGLTVVSVPESVEYIESGAFDDCEQLERITINNAECSLEEGFVSQATEIWGYEGSTAHEYAILYGNPFVNILDPPETSTTAYTGTSTTASDGTSTTATTVTTTQSSTVSDTTYTVTTTTIDTDVRIAGTLEIGTVEISLEELEANNYKVIVPVSVGDTGGWKSMGYGFAYNTDGLAVEKLDINSAVSDEIGLAGGSVSHFPAINRNEGVVWSGITLSGAEDLYFPDGVISYITFTVNPSAQAGDNYPITLLEMNNNAEHSIDTISGSGRCSFVHGAVEIIDDSFASTQVTTTTTTTTTTTITTVTRPTYTTTKTSGTTPTTTTTTATTTTQTTYTTTQTSGTTPTTTTTTATTTTQTTYTTTQTSGTTPTTTTTTATTTTQTTYTTTQTSGTTPTTTITTTTTTITTVTRPTYTTQTSGTTPTTTITTTITTTMTTTITTCTTTVYTSRTTTQTTQIQCGDLDNDGKIAVSDATAVLLLYAQNAAGLGSDEYFEMWLPFADTDENGVIEISDAVLILRYYAEYNAGLTRQSFENWRTAQ